MTRKLKTLSVALFAALALTAVMASAAVADGEYTAAEYSTTGTAESEIGNDVFETEGGTVECKSHFAATLSAPSSHLTVTPTYTPCKAFGFAHATVTMEECDYTFETPTVGTTHAGPPVSHTWTIHVKVKCPAGKEIKVVAGNCEIRIPEQTPGGHVIAEATTHTPTSPDFVDVRATVTGIDYTIVKDGFLCPFETTGETLPATRTDGSYTQTKAIPFKSTNGKSITIS